MKPLYIKLYDIARTKMNFNDNDAMEFVSSIHELNDHRFENLVTKEFLSEKINGIDQRFVKLESNIDLRFISAQASNSQQFTEVKASIDTKIAEARSDLTKWMFIFWAGQMTISVGILLLILNK
jgi:hypothetical protein